MGSNPTEVKFSLTRGDSQISFKRGIPKGDLVYRQYCLLPAPKHILKIKIIIAYFPGATRFPYYISIPVLLTLFYVCFNAILSLFHVYFEAILNLFYVYFKAILTLFYVYFKAILSLFSKVISSSSQFYPCFI